GHRRPPKKKRLPPEMPLLAPAVGRRLIGDARVIRAIGQLVRGLAAAEKELAAAGIADRPAAGMLAELQQGLALLHRDLDQLRLRLHVVVVGERRIAAHRRPRYPQHAARTGLARARRGGGGALGAAREAEAVHLADYGVAGDAAEFRGDLTGGKAVSP